MGGARHGRRKPPPVAGGLVQVGGGLAGLGDRGACRQRYAGTASTQPEYYESWGRSSMMPPSGSVSDIPDRPGMARRVAVLVRNPPRTRHGPARAKAEINLAPRVGWAGQSQGPPAGRGYAEVRDVRVLV